MLAVWAGQHPVRWRRAQWVRAVPRQVHVRDVQPQEGGAQEEPPRRIHVPVPAVGRDQDRDAQARLPFRLRLALPRDRRPKEIKAAGGDE